MTGNYILSGNQTPAEHAKVALAVLIVATIAGVLAGLAWAAPTVAAWVHSGELPRLSVGEAVAALGDARLRGPDPASAYPARVEPLLPDSQEFWRSAALSWIALIGALVAVG